MGTYIIIGGDGKEYGPITAADLRQWIAEGRLNRQSLAKSTSDAEFRPLDKFPELDDIWSGGAPSPITPVPSVAEMTGEYELDLGACVSNGWEATKKNYGMFFVSVLVLIGIRIALSSLLNVALVGPLTKAFTSPLVTVGVGFLLLVLNAPVVGPLQGGVYLVFLKTIRGEPTGTGEIFAGFSKSWSQLFFGWLIVSLVGALCLSPASYVVAVKINPLLLQLHNLQSPGAAPGDVGKNAGQLLSQVFSGYASALPITAICMIPYLYLYVCWQFTVALIIDKQLSVGAAMLAGWRCVNRHWWLVFGLSVIADLIVLIGLLGCGIGIIFTIPIGCAIMMFGYETIFSGKKY